MNENFFQQLKQQFRNKKISVTVAEAIDETEYLLSSPANTSRLLTSIENAKKEYGVNKINLNSLKDNSIELNPDDAIGFVMKATNTIKTRV